MKTIKFELPEFYNVTCVKATDTFCKYIYKYEFKGHVLPCPVEDNGKCLESNKYLSWKLN